MINLRFHLVSLVAVFLALGVGVTMGASFVNRATVDTLRNRVDALEASYKDRGGLLEDISNQLRTVDGSAEALVGRRSPVLPGRLTGRRIVEVLPPGLPDKVVAATEQALATSGAVRSGTLTVEPSLDLTDERTAAEVRDRLGLTATSPAATRRELLDRLGSALAVLTTEVPAGSPPTTTLARPDGPGLDLVRIAEARTFVRDAATAGVVTLDTASAPDAAGVPDVDGVTYVMLVSPDLPPSVNRAVVDLAAAVARRAPSAVAVGEASAVRAPGDVTTSTSLPDAAALGVLRTDGDLAERVSTVDDLEEPFGRLALVLALEQAADGTVGHYGNGPGATAPFPLSRR